MSKLSKIVKNEKRKVIVARYAARRQELKRIIAAPGTAPNSAMRLRLLCRSCLEMRHRLGCALVMLLMADPGASSVGLASPGFVSARWRIAENYPV